MTRSEFIKEVAARAGKTQVAIKEDIEAMETVIADTLASGEDVKVLNGLTLEVKDVPERERRNPATGETFIAPAHQTVKAKLGIAIKNTVA